MGRHRIGWTDSYEPKNNMKKKNEILFPRNVRHWIGRHVLDKFHFIAMKNLFFFWLYFFHFIVNAPNWPNEWIQFNKFIGLHSKMFNGTIFMLTNNTNDLVVLFSYNSLQSWPDAGSIGQWWFIIRLLSEMNSSLWINNFERKLKLNSENRRPNASTRNFFSFSFLSDLGSFWILLNVIDYLFIYLVVNIYVHPKLDSIKASNRAHTVNRKTVHLWSTCFKWWSCDIDITLLFTGKRKNFGYLYLMIIYLFFVNIRRNANEIFSFNDHNKNWKLIISH